MVYVVLVDWKKFVLPALIGCVVIATRGHIYAFMGAVTILINYFCRLVGILGCAILVKQDWDWQFFYLVPLIMPVADTIAAIISYYWVKQLHFENEFWDRNIWIVFQQFLVLKVSLIVIVHVIARKFKFVKDVLVDLNELKKYMLFEEYLCCYVENDILVPNFKVYLYLQPCINEMKYKGEIDNVDFIYWTDLIYQSRYPNYYMKDSDKDFNYFRFTQNNTENNVECHVTLDEANAAQAYDHVMLRVYQLRQAHKHNNNKNENRNRNRNNNRSSCTMFSVNTKASDFVTCLTNMTGDDVAQLCIDYCSKMRLFRSSFNKHVSNFSTIRTFISIAIMFAFLALYARDQLFPKWESCHVNFMATGAAIVIVIGQMFSMTMVTWINRCLAFVLDQIFTKQTPDDGKEKAV